MLARLDRKNFATALLRFVPISENERLVRSNGRYDEISSFIIYYLLALLHIVKNVTHESRDVAQYVISLMILPQVPLRKPCYDFYFL